ncbi:hypothetical protein JTB14_026886 [Gonioctena quinquepunctata]|nr:hypothetical protein JTB14_026886 [Gonioctena quinquepunctata]
MAKVSKLLILNERGEASKCEGKTLDEIEIDLNVVEENSDEDDDGEEIDDRNQQESIVVMGNKAYRVKYTRIGNILAQQRLHMAKPPTTVYGFNHSDTKVRSTYFSRNLNYS